MLWVIQAGLKSRLNSFAPVVEKKMSYKRIEYDSNTWENEVGAALYFTDDGDLVSRKYFIRELPGESATEITKDKFLLLSQGLTNKGNGSPFTEHWTKVTSTSNTTTRDDGPAMVSKSTGGELHQYFKDNCRHRIGGPAIEDTGKPTYKEYFEEGVRHRVGLPAISIGGIDTYCEKGLVHRTNGPAVYDNNGKTASQFWFNGKLLSEAEYRKVAPDYELGIRCEQYYGYVEFTKPDGTVHRESGPARVFESGEMIWMKDGLQQRDDGGPTHVWADGGFEYCVKGVHHRVGGPAVRSYDEMDGSYEDEWAIDGEYHRIDGPAYYQMNSDGTLTFEEWYLKDERHRLDGPAFRNTDGNLYYYVFGTEVSEEQFMSGSVQIDVEENEEFCKAWVKTNAVANSDQIIYHRINGPALISSRGQFWFVNGNRHNENGPAVVWSDGTVEYWLDDCCYTKQQFDNWKRSGSFLNDDTVVDAKPVDEVSTEEMPSEKSEQDSGMAWGTIAATGALAGLLGGIIRRNRLKKKAEAQAKMKIQTKQTEQIEVDDV